MSRLAKRPIELPTGVEVQLKGKSIEVKGPKGVISQDFPEGLILNTEGNSVVVSMEEGAFESAFLGLYRSLIQNAVTGVAKGFVKKLTLIGVGFRAAVKGNALDLQLGFSHPSELKIPEGIEVKVEKSTTIIISGTNKQVVGQFAADIRSLRPPEPYKGKGVRYEDEYVRRKAGKAAKGK